MSEFGDLYLKYYAIHEAINRILAEAPEAIDPDDVVTKLRALHPELAATMPNLRQEIVAAAREVRAPITKDGNPKGDGL
jgi:hypothetical protein